MQKQIIILGSLFFSLCFFAFWFFLKIPLEIPFPPESPRIFDKNNTLLFWGISLEEEYFWKVDFDDISPSFVVAATLAEDERFWTHSGVDALAIFRALSQNLLSGSVISGASTITQQVAKKIQGNLPRTLRSKITETALALRLEEHFSKEEIFSAWANLAPFSGNIRGIEAASRLFFGKSAKRLTPAEAAFLAALPQNPHRKYQQILLRQKRILEKMHETGFLTESEWETALSEKIPSEKIFPPNSAPHFSQMLREQFPEKTEIFSSLDLFLQQEIEKILRGNLPILSAHNANNSALLVFENATGAVRVWIGSADFSNKSIDGQVDVLRSFRQMGSTLKPFLYLRAFEKMNWSGATEILDEPKNFPVDFGNFFEPKNYDLDFRGKMTVRSALAESRNIPAVATLEKVGISDFLEVLKMLGAEFLSKNPETSGLGIALGSAEMRLQSLAKIYGVLARKGMDFAWCFDQWCPVQQGREILDKKLVLEITDILSDNSARVPSFSENSALNFSFPVAAKTGTTRNFNDNFVVGYTSDFTILVWVGNSDGTAMEGVSGISGAGPLFHNVVLLLAKKYPPRLFEKPLPRDSTKDDFSALRLLSPLSGSRFAIDPYRDIQAQKILFETSISADFFLDNIRIFSGTRFLWIPQKGRHILRAETAEDSAETIFWVE